MPAANRAPVEILRNRLERAPLPRDLDALDVLLAQQRLALLLPHAFSRADLSAEETSVPATPFGLGGELVRDDLRLRYRKLTDVQNGSSSAGAASVEATPRSRNRSKSTADRGGHLVLVALLLHPSGHSTAEHQASFLHRGASQRQPTIVAEPAPRVGRMVNAR